MEGERTSAQGAWRGARGGVQRGRDVREGKGQGQRGRGEGGKEKGAEGRKWKKRREQRQQGR